MMRMGSLIVGLALVAVGIADAADALSLVVDPAWVEATSGARELWPLTRTTEALVLSGAARMPYADAMQMGLQVGRSYGGDANLIASLVFESWARTDRTPRRPRHGAVGRVPPASRIPTPARGGEPRPALADAVGAARFGRVLVGPRPSISPRMGEFLRRPSVGDSLVVGVTGAGPTRANPGVVRSPSGTPQGAARPAPGVDRPVAPVASGAGGSPPRPGEHAADRESSHV